MTYTTSEILDLAADDLQRNGWTQGNKGMNVEGPHCALGAIAHVVGVHVVTPPRGHDDLLSEASFYSYDEALRCPAGRALTAYLPSNAVAIYYWNDALNREGWEVIAALRAAAAIERVKETSTEKVPA